MRILKVNENTVRIFISFAELADRNISLVDFFQRSSRTEHFFWEVISKARDEVDFNLDQPFWVQATVASEDEFVITVIKQDDHIDADINHFVHTGLEDMKKSRSSTKSAAEQEWVYVFEDLEDAISAAALLPDAPGALSTLYTYEDEYYLTLSKIGSQRKKKIAEAVLDEFGESVLTTGDFLKEHGEVVIEKDAINSLKSIVIK